MSESNFTGVVLILVSIGYIAAFIGSGMIAWDWIEPESFWGGIKFLIAWAILGYVLKLIVGIIGVVLAKMFE